MLHSATAQRTMSSLVQKELAAQEYVDVKAHLDFAANSFLVLAAYLMRCSGYMKDEHISGLKFLTFGISLPVLICSTMWTAEFKAEMFTIMIVSASVHLFVPVVSYIMYSRVKPSDLRGFMQMVNQGEGLAYAYQAALASFGPEGLAGMCLWDLGGNIWLAMFGNGIAASVFRPPPPGDSAESAGILRDDAEPPVLVGQPLRQRCGTNDKKVSPIEGIPEPRVEHSPVYNFSVQVVPSPSPPPALQPQLATMSTRGDLEAMAAVLEEPAASAARGILGRTGRCWKAAAPILKLPMLWGVCVGLILNLCRVPLHYMPVKVMHVLAQCFPPLLYVLLGSVLRFRLGAKEYRIVLQALVCRWMLLGAISVLIWHSSLDKFVRAVAVLALATPCTTTLLIYGAEFGFDAGRCAMTYNISALCSFMAIHLINLFLVAEVPA